MSRHVKRRVSKQVRRKSVSRRRKTAKKVMRGGGEEVIETTITSSNGEKSKLKLSIKSYLFGGIKYTLELQINQKHLDLIETKESKTIVFLKKLFEYLTGNRLPLVFYDPNFLINLADVSNIWRKIELLNTYMGWKQAELNSSYDTLKSEIENLLQKPSVEITISESNGKVTFEVNKYLQLNLRSESSEKVAECLEYGFRGCIHTGEVYDEKYYPENIEYLEHKSEASLYKANKVRKSKESTNKITLPGTIEGIKQKLIDNNSVIQFETLMRKQDT